MGGRRKQHFVQHHCQLSGHEMNLNCKVKLDNTGNVIKSVEEGPDRVHRLEYTAKRTS
jgi:hypothetical protein